MSEKNTNIGSTGSEQIVNQKIDERVKSVNKKTTKQLEPGKSITTIMGGYNYPIMFKEVLAGETIESWNIQSITRLLTPLVPTLDRIYLTFTAFFVPHTRVWDGAERAFAAKNDLSQQGLGGMEELEVPYASVGELNQAKSSMYKMTLASRYGMPNNTTTATNINILPIRGYRAIENDFWLINELEIKRAEYKNGSQVSAAEKALLNCITTIEPVSIADVNAYAVAPAKARNGYLTNLKKTMQLDDSAMPTTNVAMFEHLDWQARYNNAKQSALNTDKRDQDIIAEMGGTQAVTADRVEMLGIQEIELNYQQITQSAPTIDGSSPLGTAGSFSYTQNSGDLFNHKHFQQAGYIHIIMNVNMDQIFENSIPKELFKLLVEDYYRPGLAEKQTQLLKKGEINGRNSNPDQGIYYQPPWAEYNRVPNLVTGEMRSQLLDGGVTNSQWHNAFQNGPDTITEHYFKPANYVNQVLARNNVLGLTTEEATYKGNDFQMLFVADPIMNETLHKVKVSLPISNSILTGTDYTTDIK